MFRGMILPRIYFSRSLSRSCSTIFVGGGFLASSGLKISFDLMFPISLIIWENDHEKMAVIVEQKRGHTST